MPAPVPFEEAKNRRQRARAAGLHPDHWYPVEHANKLAIGEVKEVQFWGKSLALYRGTDGCVRCVLNRCCHRQLKLSKGEVRDCEVVCVYHGWSYDGEGRLTGVSHELFGRKLPKLKLPHFRVRERYGLIWVFPGDPKLADRVPMPEIAELEGPERWSCVPVDVTCNAHHSMIMENICDFTHGYLHRKWEPFRDAKLTGTHTDGDNIFVEYDTKVGAGRYMSVFVNRKKTSANRMRLCFEYPYQWSNTDDWIRHWCFLLPIDERTTRAFFLFYFKSLRLPGTSFDIPRALMTPLLKVANRLMVRPVLEEDRIAVEAEQEGWERHFDAPMAELNPVVGAFQSLTARKWQEYLDTRESLAPELRLPIDPSRDAERERNAAHLHQVRRTEADSTSST